MKYYTENELQNFRFEGAYIAETCAVNGIFEMILDNVTILPQNSCNRDIREMRANELKLKIREPEITAFVEEGYKVYDADGNLKEKKEDILIAAEDQAAKLKELEGCEIYSIEQAKAPRHSAELAAMVLEAMERTAQAGEQQMLREDGLRQKAELLVPLARIDERRTEGDADEL